MTELVLKQEVYEIVGSAMEVYFRLGSGFLEPIYQEAIEIELSRRSIPFEARKKLTISYKGQPLRKKYIPDLFCFNQIIAELKVCERLESRQVAQLINYLRATGCRVGLLINFGSSIKLEWKRYVL
jgi:GxxExxY protein